MMDTAYVMNHRRSNGRLVQSVARHMNGFDGDNHERMARLQRPIHGMY